MTDQTIPIRAPQFTPELDRILASNGKELLPNLEPIPDPAEALLAIARTRGMYPNPPYQLKLNHGIGYHPKIFLNTDGMRDEIEGSGVVLFSGWPAARAFRFAFCRHEWDTSGGNPSRGWHPKHCIHCRFDASIDSGD